MAGSGRMSSSGSDFNIGLDATGAIRYRGTGIGTYAYQLAFNLSKMAKENISFLLPGAEFNGLQFDDSSVFGRMLNNPKYYQEEFLPEWLSQNKIDLYHVPQNGIGLPISVGCKRIVTIHDLIPYVYPESVGRSYLKEFLGQMPDIIEYADGIIAVSEYTKADILRYFDYPEERICVIYEAAEPVYAPTSKNTCKSVLKRQYGIENDFLLYVGGFGSRKNLTCLFTALALVSGKLSKEIKLVCPGRSNHAKSYLKELAKALNIEKSVILPGFVPVNSLPYFYGGAEAMIYPSLYEGFGLPILEAMACGCPVLSADNSSLPEIGGNAAVYFNALDCKSLADVISDVIEDKEMLTEISYNGLRHSANFDWQKNAKETLTFYKKIMEMPFKHI